MKAGAPGTTSRRRSCTMSRQPIAFPTRYAPDSRRAAQSAHQRAATTAKLHFATGIRPALSSMAMPHLIHLHPNIIYGAGRTEVSRYDMVTGQVQNVTPLPMHKRDFRADRTQPILFSPVDPHTLYYAANHLFKTTDDGHTWQIDQSRPEPGEDGQPPSVPALTPDNRTNGAASSIPSQLPIRRRRRSGRELTMGWFGSRATAEQTGRTSRRLELLPGARLRRSMLRASTMTPRMWQ